MKKSIRNNQNGIATTTVVIALVAVIAIGGGAATYVATDGFNFQQQKEAASDQDQSQSQEQQAQDATQQEESAEKSQKSLIESALAGNKSIKCTYNYQDGSQGTAYLKADRTFRVEQKTAEGDLRMIKLSEKAYIWEVGQNTGFILNASAFDEKYREQVPIFDVEAVEEGAEAQNNNVECEETGSFDSELFTPPSNVDFQNPADRIPNQSSSQ